jgi:DNA-binding response OmpR family regulator
VTKRKVLVVDDNESNRIILSRCVLRAGFDAIVASDGASALAAIADQAPDLVMLDWNMPDLHGIDLLKAIRADYPAARLPVIMCSARTSPRDMAAAREAGADDFITKPIDIAAAIALIETTLARHGG